MSQLKLAEVLKLDKVQQAEYLSALNVQLEKLSAIERIEWALDNLPAKFVLSSSFGIQAALMH
ncbi:phosphoadenosine phosphosulfate reductase, partial [Escherichia coli]|nr:phosphoadenosine phosphosulfate reductase [Escherichia coli]